MDSIESKVGHLEGKVNDLMRWRDVFEADIKDSLRSLDSKFDRELNEIKTDVKGIGEEVRNALKVTANRLPVWAAVTGGMILAVAGWFVEWAIFHH